MPGTVEERVALALAALAEVTDPADVGALLEAEVVEPGVVDLRFACTLPGYAAWRWTVSTSDLPDTEPTVLEVELLPGDDALLAPPWVPWTERLAEWRKQHPDEQHAVDDEVDADDEAELDEDDLGVDDELDELDETQLDAAGRTDEDSEDEDDDPDEDDSDEDDSDEDDSDEDDDSEEDDDLEDESDDDGFEGDDPSAGSGRRARGPRPGDEDRSL